MPTARTDGPASSPRAPHISSTAPPPHSHRPAAQASTTSDAWPHRSLLGLQGLSADELRTLLVTARGFAEVSTRSIKKVPSLRGKVVANLFFEDSTRTRLSFTLAAQRLSADVIDLTSATSSVNKGETIVDTALNIHAMGVDAMVVRHKASGAARLVASAVDCAVINAGDGRHEHPTQGLLDIYTLAEARGRLEAFDLSELTVIIVGDIVSSRVARSNIAGLTTLGAKVVCIGPPTLVPRNLESLGCTVAHDLDVALREHQPDAINMLRIQFERHGGGSMPHATSGAGGAPGGGAGAHAKPGAAATSGIAGGGAFPSIREYIHGFALTADRAAQLKPGAVVMHPGPMNRGIEIADEVADGPRSVILRQVSHGLSVRMAALYLCVAAADRR